VTVAIAVTASLATVPVVADGFSLVYSVPGAVKSAKVGTAVSCTNVDTASIDYRVRFFDADGVMENSIVVFSTLAPGASQTWAAAANTLPSFPTVVQENLPTFSGSARIAATSTKLICTAFVLDTTSDPPISMKSLPVIRKLAQKGD
jgi:hypothetical protein